MMGIHSGYATFHVMDNPQKQIPPATSAFHMNGVFIEPDALRISRVGNSQRLEPKVMNLLVALSQRPGQLWSRDELLTHLWPDGTGSDETLTRVVYQLRKALTRVGAIVDALRTVPKLGYRLDAEVWADESNASTETLKTAPFPAFSVAVLPVQDLSEGNSGQLLADGLTRDLTMLLSRTPRFRVSAPSFAARFSADSEDMASVGKALKARYLVTATLARHASQVSIRAELSEAAHSVLLWADKYVTGFDGFFEVQEEVVCSITTAIAAKVNVTQPLRVRRTGRFNLSAYERVQAAEALRLKYSRENAMKIITMLDDALAIEPDDPITRASLAVQLSQNVVSQWEQNRKATIKRADKLIADALAHAPNDPEVRAGAGVVATMFHRPDDAILHLEIATARNPNDAHALAVLGWQHCLRHADPGGIGLIETAERRAPHHPRFGLWATYRTTGHLFMLDFADGLQAAKQAIERTPKYYQPLLNCAWAHIGLDDKQNAKRQVRRAQALESDDILEKFVVEMRKWSANSPYKTQCWEVLDRLLQIS
jgi:TolB-like protein